jgi:hypothetical protein
MTFDEDLLSARVEDVRSDYGFCIATHALDLRKCLRGCCTAERNHEFRVFRRNIG